MYRSKILLLAGSVFLIACGGGDSSGYVISGKVQGLDGSLTIQNNAKDDITIEEDGTFTFKTKLAAKENFDVQVFQEPCAQRCTIKNGKGTVGNKNVDGVEIICIAKTWSEEKDFLSETAFKTSNAEIEDVALDKKGSAIVIWSYNDDLTVKHYKSEYRKGVWHHPARDDFIGFAGYDLGSLQVAMNNNDDAIIIWQQRDPLTAAYNIYKMEYKNSVWIKPILSDQINIAGMNAWAPKIAFNDLNEAIIVWYVWSGAPEDTGMIFKSEYRDGVWTYPKSLKDKINLTENFAFNPLVTINKSGQAVIIWTEEENDNIHIFKTEYLDGKWKYPESSFDYINPNNMTVSVAGLTMDSFGNVIIAWRGADAGYSPDKVYVSERRDGKWKYPATSDYVNTEHYANNLLLAMSENGDAVISWTDAPPDSSKDTFRAEYRNGKWNWPFTKSDAIISDDYSMVTQIEMDNYGNALFFWFYNDFSTSNLHRQEYTLDHWGNSKEIPGASKVAMNECRKIVFWGKNVSDVNKIYFQQYN